MSKGTTSLFGREDSTCDTVLMVSPDHFEYNAETGQTNTFQKMLDVDDLSDRVMMEFNLFQEKLRAAGVRVITLASRSDVRTPDAVFPNNWFSVHRDLDAGCSRVVYFPMLNENRQRERRPAELVAVLEEHGIGIDDSLDLTHWESCGRALEGTGSLVLDRLSKKAYAAVSSRMDEEILREFCSVFGYSPVCFTSTNGSPANVVYHTNVMMSVGTRLAVLCADSIAEESQRRCVEDSLQGSGKLIMRITLDQMNSMCGNVLELRAVGTGQAVFAMSTTAFEAFTPAQRELFEQNGVIVHSDIYCIETVGGGSARCMLAEIFT